ncbi:hypothetical protein [Streptomyces sp. NPDC057494]|uniref:hypothetical protein n=1 Tax=Streptomyces sp. NPDC057494 TaxID=3346148 RepID=UPI0036C595AB
MSPRIERIRSEPRPRHGYTHVQVTVTQHPSAHRTPDGCPGQDAVDGETGDVSFAFSVPHGSEAAGEVPPDTRDADLVLGHARLVDDLLGSAVDAPHETVTRLLASPDFHLARLGRAIHAIQEELLRTERNTDGPHHAGSSRSDTTALDPVTHDPAW